MERLKNKRYVISLFVTVIGLIALISGTSYAILKGSTTSTNEQVIKAGSVELKLTENYDSIDNGVSVMKDVDGLLQETVYEFTVTNIGSVSAKYDLKLLNEAPSGQTALDDQYIRLGLEVNGQEMGPMGLSKVNNVIDSNTIAENEVIRYKLRVWLDKSKQSEIEEVQNNKAYLSLKVEAEQSEYVPRVVYRYGTDLLHIGSNIEHKTGTKWIVKVNGEENSQVNQLAQQNFGTYYWDTHQECASAITSMGYSEGSETPLGVVTCSEKTGAFGSIDYTTDYTTLNKTYFLKHILNANGNIESNEVCFIKDNTLYCLKGEVKELVDNKYYKQNESLLLDVFGQNNCTIDETGIRCSGSGFEIFADDTGTIFVTVGSSNCHLTYDCYSRCDND